jgi:hypothetical protein
VTVDLGVLLTELAANGWGVALLLVLAIGVGIPWLLVTDRISTRGRLRSVERDRDYWRKAAELERTRSDRAQATVSAVLPAAETAVRVVQAFTEVTGEGPVAVIERGDRT